MSARRTKDPFGVRVSFDTGSGKAVLYSLERLEHQGLGHIGRLPYSLRVLLENLLRHCDRRWAGEQSVLSLARREPGRAPAQEVAFLPARVVLQDFTGVPAVVDLAAMRAAVRRLGGDPRRVNPLVPADLVIDHSVQVDSFGTVRAFAANVAREVERNRERYALLRWAQRAFANFRVVPPGTGIIHQVNLEYLAPVVVLREQEGEPVAFPDTLVGTDSHTTMINGLGVLGWGVGGIEAEAVLLGQPYFMLLPPVVGVRLTGELPEGATATDLVLTVTQVLRRHGVVGKFVEFFGPGVAQLSLPDRATLGNMAPEYGATVGFFPVDGETLHYLRETGRDESLVQLVERYTKEQGLFSTGEAPVPEYDEQVEIDLAAVEPSVAGPRRPQDRVPLAEVKRNFLANLREYWGKEPGAPAQDGMGGSGQERDRGGPLAVAARPRTLTHGAVAIAAITSCTNTSNPSLMLAAGLLARKAVERGLSVKPWVKTSLAPGSRVVTDYLRSAGLLPYLEALRFHVVGYGCTTCIGNSGELPAAVAREVQEGDLVVAAVLSGNRNFEGRINPLTRASYLASPPLVVAYALAGRVDIDLTTEPLGEDPNGEPVYLKEIWPTPAEVQEAVERCVGPELFRDRYARVFEGDDAWQALPVPEGELYPWDPASTYVQEPPFFRDLPLEPGEPADIRGARVLAVLGDSVTTDHISPAGAIPADSPAGRYLRERGVAPRDFNTFGARRGNHEVMVRGTFGNIRLRNRLAPGTEGGWTRHLPDGEVMPLYDAVLRYRAEGVPLLVLAGKEYGTGSSRDWAAKGTALLGVKAVLAESFERIHRSNLVGMGVLPLQFRPGEGREQLGLDGTEVYDIEGIRSGLAPGQDLTVRARRADGEIRTFTVRARLDSPVEVEYYRNGGILPTVLRRLVRESGPEPSARPEP